MGNRAKRNKKAAKNQKKVTATVEKAAKQDKCLAEAATIADDPTYAKKHYAMADKGLNAVTGPNLYDGSSTQRHICVHNDGRTCDHTNDHHSPLNGKVKLTLASMPTKSAIISEKGPSPKYKFNSTLSLTVEGAATDANVIKEDGTVSETALEDWEARKARETRLRELQLQDVELKKFQPLAELGSDYYRFVMDDNRATKYDRAMRYLEKSVESEDRKREARKAHQEKINERVLKNAQALKAASFRSRIDLTIGNKLKSRRTPQAKGEGTAETSKSADSKNDATAAIVPIFAAEWELHQKYLKTAHEEIYRELLGLTHSPFLNHRTGTTVQQLAINGVASPERIQFSRVRAAMLNSKLQDFWRQRKEDHMAPYTWRNLRPIGLGQWTRYILNVHLPSQGDIDGGLCDGREGWMHIGTNEDKRKMVELLTPYMQPMQKRNVKWDGDFAPFRKHLRYEGHVVGSKDEDPSDSNNVEEYFAFDEDRALHAVTWEFEMRKMADARQIYTSPQLPKGLFEAARTHEQYMRSMQGFSEEEDIDIASLI